MSEEHVEEYRLTEDGGMEAGCPGCGIFFKVTQQTLVWGAKLDAYANWSGPVAFPVLQWAQDVDRADAESYLRIIERFDPPTVRRFLAGGRNFRSRRAWRRVARHLGVLTPFDGARVAGRTEETS